jgi:hypothetical protein
MSKRGIFSTHRNSSTRLLVLESNLYEHTIVCDATMHFFLFWCVLYINIHTRWRVRGLSAEKRSRSSRKIIYCEKASGRIFSTYTFFRISHTQIQLTAAYMCVRLCSGNIAASRREKSPTRISCESATTRREEDFQRKNIFSCWFKFSSNEMKE